MNKKKFDLILILIWPIIASVLVLLFKLISFWSILLFFGLVPVLLLSLRIKKEVPKALLFSLVCLPIYIIIESVGIISGSWVIPSAFPFSIFGATVEGITFGFLTVYFVVMFYEYFLDKHITKKLFSPKFKYFVILSLSLFSIFLFLFFGFPQFLNIPYAYLALGLLFILLPSFIELVKYPKLSKKLVITAAYFFYASFIGEIIGLKLGWWSFPTDGEFIWWIKIFGESLPFEELFFYITLTALAIISFFEFFDDDEK